MTFNNGYGSIPRNVRDVYREQGLPYSPRSIPQIALDVPLVTALPRNPQDGTEVNLIGTGNIVDRYIYLRRVPGWVRMNDTVPPVAPSTTFPTDPVEGDTFIYDTGTSGVRWQFVYDTSDGTTYPWLFVGGAELYAEVTTNQATSSTSYADLSTAGPTVTNPLAGDYAVSWGCWATGDTATAQLFMSIKRGASATSDTDGIRLQPADVAYYAAGQSQRTRQFTSLAASTALKAQYKTNAGSANFESRWVSIKPIRVG